MAASIDRDTDIDSEKILVGNWGNVAQTILEKLKENKFASDIRTCLDNVHVKNISVKDGDKAKRWIKWANDERNLKVVKCPVPHGILPEGRTGQLLDVKVFTKYGPDDPIYDNSPTIRDRVARGNCFLEIFDGPETGFSCALFAMKKFTGGLGDDDDREKGDNFTWKRYFIKPMDQASYIITTRKANGEAAHLSCCVIDGQMVFCGGSKNVHMLFNRQADIDKYSGDRFRIASEICTTILQRIQKMTSEERNRLMSFLACTKLTGVFEILSPYHQHVEDLSHLSSPELKFITWTSFDFESESQLCTVPPHVGIEIARSLGLDPVSYEVIQLSELDERMAQIRQGYNYEGEVFYFLDSTNAVIGLLKKKTIWYIICRAIREKVKAASRMYQKSPDTYSVSKSIKKLATRMKEIQNWLGLDDESLQKWNELGTAFLKWTIHYLGSGEGKIDEVADNFPVVWKKFLNDTGSTDKIASKWEEPSGSDT